jgi:hypothetical protein
MPDVDRAEAVYRSAEVDLEQTRATFTELGAAAWLRDLDSALAGVSA